MKKFFTLLVSALVAGSAMAAPSLRAPFTISEMKQDIDLTKCQKMGSAKMTASAVVEDNGVLRSMERQDDKSKYEMLFFKIGKITDVFSFTSQTTGEEIPWEDLDCYYMILMTNQGMAQANSGNMLQYYVAWPCKAALVDELYEGSSTINWEKAAQRFGSLEIAQSAASINEVLAEQQSFPCLDNFYGLPQIMPARTGSGLSYGGKTGLQLKSNTVTNNGITQDGSYFVFNSYDPDFNEADIEFHYVLGAMDATGYGATAPYTNATYVLKGNPTTIGFFDINVNSKELHVFDCGLTDNDSYYGTVYDPKNVFTPVQRYYLAWVDPTMSFMGQKQNGDKVTSWDDINALTELEPCAVASENYTYTFFLAALFTAKDAALEGLWTMPKPDYTLNDRYQLESWNSVPTAMELVPYMDCSEAEQDGFRATMFGYGAGLINPEPEMSWIGFGDKNVGFSYKFASNGMGGYYVSGNCTEPYYYHGNAADDDFAVTDQRPCVGTANANALNQGLIAVEAVESNAPVVSTQYFNLQGQRLNVAPEKGIFIQRNVKADGTVKAVKVVK